MKTGYLIRFTLIAFVLAITPAGCSKSLVHEGFDWPRWRGPTGDGVSKETNWNPKALDSPRVSWMADVGTGYSSVAIKANRLITSGIKEGTTVVFCFSADTGKALWEYPLGGVKFPQATPTIDGESVYALSAAGVLVCLDIGKGRLKWKKDLVSEYGAVQPFYNFAGSPVIEGDLLLLTANTSGIAVKKATGELAWRSASPPEPHYWSDSSTGVEYATPVIYEQGGKRIALICSYAGLHSVDVSTGAVAWVFRWPGGYDTVVADPLLVGGSVLIVQYHSEPLGSALIDIGGQEPRLLWSDKKLCSQISNPVLVDDYIYACYGGPDEGDASVRCMDAATGRVLWDRRPVGDDEKVMVVSLAAAAGKLIIMTGRGNIAVAEASPKAYKEIARADLRPLTKKAGNRFWTPPVLCNGRLYCRGHLGDLLCIDVSN
jgi:outer membrane protein assembly factor BamB